MNRYEIALGKPPPPPRPKKKKEPEFLSSRQILGPSYSRVAQIYADHVHEHLVSESGDPVGIGTVGINVNPSAQLQINREPIHSQGFGDRVPEVPTLENSVHLIADLISTPQGRVRLAALMVRPMQERVNYRSLARRIFQVDHLDINPEESRIPQYDFNPAGTFVINEQGTAAINLADNMLVGRHDLRVHSPETVIAPLFEVSSNPQIPLMQIQERRFNLIERAQELAVHEITMMEDERALMILDAVANGCNRNIPVPRDAFNTPRAAQDIFRDAFARIEANDLRVTNVLLNAQDYATIRNYAFLNSETDASILRQGIMANLFGAQMIVSRRIPAGRIYLTAEPSSVGRMPIRTDVTVLASDSPMEHTIGWCILEQIGMLCNNPFSVMRISL